MGCRSHMSVVQATEMNVGLSASSWAGTVSWRAHMLGCQRLETLE